MSSARPKLVLLLVVVPPYSRWPLCHINFTSQLWSRHKSDALYFRVPADTTPKDMRAFLWTFKYAVIALAAHLTKTFNRCQR